MPTEDSMSGSQLLGQHLQTVTPRTLPQGHHPQTADVRALPAVTEPLPAMYRPTRSNQRTRRTNHAQPEASTSSNTSAVHPSSSQASSPSTLPLRLKRPPRTFEDSLRSYDYDISIIRGKKKTILRLSDVQRRAEKAARSRTWADRRPTQQMQAALRVQAQDARK